MWIRNFTPESISKGNENHNSKRYLGNNLTVQWLGLHTFTAGVLGSIPGQETKIPQAVQCGQKKKKMHSQVHDRIIYDSKDKETTSVSMMDKWIRTLWHTHILCVCVCVCVDIHTVLYFVLSTVLRRVLFGTLWNAAHQAVLSFINYWTCSNSCPLSQWCHPTISS